VPLRIGIIGPSRTRNGTGPFVARFFEESGARVIAVAASTPASSERSAATLRREFGHDIASYPSAGAMMARAELDAVAVCSPTEDHGRQLKAALEAGLHVFCEKPLLWCGDGRDPARAADLVRGFTRKRLVLHHNTQWRFVLHDVRRLLGERRVLGTHLLEVSLAPPAPGPTMHLEAGPHAISLMVALGATGELEETRARWNESGTHLEVAMIARRRVEPLAARIILQSCAAQPRPAQLAFDGCRVDRVVTSLDPYALALRCDGRVLPIVDPVLRSVRAFLRDVRVDGCDRAAHIVTEISILERTWRAVIQARERDQPSR
jgi:hypothetical protein